MMLAALLLTLATPASGGDIARWLEGRFNNGAQVQAEGDPARPHLYVIHEGFTSDAVPGALIYAQLHVGGPDGEVYRQRVYAFEDPSDDGRLRMAVYTLADPASLASPDGRAERLASLTANDLVRSDPECDFHWQRDGGSYAGEIEDGACLITSSRTGREMIITARFTIDADIFTHIEAGRFAESGETAFDAPGGVPNIYDRLD
ncbi:MAG: chromophore lyase CpcT/CpeT [Oceanicaulis sp.]|uniref:chromophore lyase CpcT/CpeT n=1 Tax=Glycocaulis sp. TaxID=1969725 RepID=UPI0025C20202|nr:chromophore lyase CpcT/CpeT [Glycocaulis sp.]MCC5980931.1 chromophore lyase CpcT/CpeT [Oceanicaulis sp.]MCH8521649.1 chromophore lyase CpcT/CpeT [Glycocaulis sp.]